MDLVARTLLPGLAVAFLLLLVSCGVENAGDAGPSLNPAKLNGTAFDADFTLQLLHASDMDGSTGALSNVETFAAILDGFRWQYPENTIVLSSGGQLRPRPALLRRR